MLLQSLNICSHTAPPLAPLLTFLFVKHRHQHHYLLLHLLMCSFFSLKHTPITSVGERAAARVERSSGAEPIIWLLGSVLIIQMPIQALFLYNAGTFQINCKQDFNIENAIFIVIHGITSYNGMCSKRRSSFSVISNSSYKYQCIFGLFLLSIILNFY